MKLYIKLANPKMHTGRGGKGGNSCTPSKVDHKNELKRENRGPPPRFFIAVIISEQDEEIGEK
jgi:hypothetical protein